MAHAESSRAPRHPQAERPQPLGTASGTERLRGKRIQSTSQDWDKSSAENPSRPLAQVGKLAVVKGGDKNSSLSNERSRSRQSCCLSPGRLTLPALAGEQSRTPGMLDWQAGTKETGFPPPFLGCIEGDQEKMLLHRWNQEWSKTSPGWRSACVPPSLLSPGRCTQRVARRCHQCQPLPASVKVTASTSPSLSVSLERSEGEREAGRSPRWEPGALTASQAGNAEIPLEQDTAGEAASLRSPVFGMSHVPSTSQSFPACVPSLASRWLSSCPAKSWVCITPRVRSPVFAPGFCAQQ